MLRTRALALLAGAILMLGLLAPNVSAGHGTELVIANDGEIGHGLITDDGGATWSDPPGPTISSCGAGYSELSPGVPDTEFRSAVEFPLGALPDDAVIEYVELRLGGAQLSSATFAIYTYPGDGSISPEDLEVTGTPSSSVLTTAGEHEMVYFAEDIPAPILAAGWLGFSMRLDPLTPGSVYWLCPETGGQGPWLAIGYTAPAGSQVPDAAMSAPLAGSPLVVIGFTLLLVAGLMAVATWGARRTAS